jgi:hypothetical protein
LPGGKIGMVTAKGNATGDEDMEFTYYDAILGLTFKFNPFIYPFTLEGEIVSEEAMEVPSNELRGALVEEVKSYLSVSFADKKALFAVNQEGDTHQVIEISCQNIKLESMWAGEWQSTWVVKDGQLSGNLKIKTHYFEMGNM